MTARVLLAVAVVAAALFFVGLDQPPFIDPPEGFHAAVAREMLAGGDWITPRINGVRYFDKPPLLYWLMATGFATLGLSPAVARLASVLPAVGVAVVTAWIGLRLGGARLGLLAGLIVAANLELFLYARLVKPDLLMVLAIVCAFAAFLEAYGVGRRGAVPLFYASLGAAALAKDILGAIGPLLVVAVFLAVTGERAQLAQWRPWHGLAVLAAVVLPWYGAMEIANPGFLWYTVVDNHALNIAQHRVFPDEDVPLGALEFLGVTAVGFLPWTAALPWAVWRALRGPWDSVERRAWLLLGMWTTLVLGVFTLSPFKLPHYGLPAFPAMALLVAKLWNDVLDGDPPAVRAMLVPALITLIAVAIAAYLGSEGRLALPGDALSTVDVATRNLAARGQDAPFATAAAIRPILGTLALIFGAGAVAVAAALALGRLQIGLGVLLAVMLAGLPVTVQGVAAFAESRSLRPLAEAVALRAGPRDVLVHEGPLENSASWLLGLARGREPVRIVNGRQSNLAVGATYPEARAIFWDGRRLAESWRGAERLFLISTLPPERSATRDLPPDSVHLLAVRGGRWLYSNRQ
ncbi:MAG: glycosyltransferase family 39 protein [Candidatus Rokuibacteriota bacterium]